MGDIMKKVSEDIDEYVKLCRYFSEEIKYSRDYYGHMIEDCYGNHAKKLADKKKQEEIHGI